MNFALYVLFHKPQYKVFGVFFARILYLHIFKIVYLIFSIQLSCCFVENRNRTVTVCLSNASPLVGPFGTKNKSLELRVKTNCHIRVYSNRRVRRRVIEKHPNNIILYYKEGSSWKTKQVAKAYDQEGEVKR